MVRSAVLLTLPLSLAHSASPSSPPLPHAALRLAIQRAARDREEDDDDDDDEEEEQEESEEEEESGDDAALKPVQAELSRAERKEMKKKKAQAAQAKKQANSDGEDEEEEEDEDPVLVNPNHSVGKRMNLADLGAPRELSRKEKLVPHCNDLPLIHDHLCYTREEKEKKEAKERYWKVQTSLVSPSIHFHISLP